MEKTKGDLWTPKQDQYLRNNCQLSLDELTDGVSALMPQGHYRTKPAVTRRLGKLGITGNPRRQMAKVAAYHRGGLK